MTGTPEYPIICGCCTKAEALLAEQDAEIARLKAALEPFGTVFAETFVDEDGWTGSMKQERIVDWFGPSDFRRARAALAGEGE